MESLEFAMGSAGGRSFLKFFLFVIFPKKSSELGFHHYFFAFLLVLIKRDVSL
jgi:hypothetical protein